MTKNKFNIKNIQKIVAREGTPCYLYDLAGIEERIAVVKKQLNSNISLIYAVKANPNLEILKKIKPLIDGLDISSGGELQQAVLAGYDPAGFSFAGPGKSDAELDLAIKSDCGSLSIESRDDLARIIARAAKLQKKANVSLRINPSELIPKFAIKMGGTATQFGVDEDEIFAVLELIKKDRAHLNFVGFHIYAGTQCLEAESLGANFKNIFGLIRKLGAKEKLNGLKLNVGGGFGIPYFDAQEPLDLKKTLEFLNNEAATPELDGVMIVLELGRYIIGEFGYYATKVLATKESRGKKYLIVDGGMHQNLSASGNLGQVIKKSYRIENISVSAGELNRYDIAGTLCTPLDMLGWGVQLPSSKVGDILVIKNSGAYGFTSSPLLFLGHETPKEVLCLGGDKYELIRRSFDITRFN